MNETGTAARAWTNPTQSEQRTETQIRRPSLRLISGLEKTERLL
jgi:cystathionine beta-lyase/cystathionine gamma-synthase